MIISASRRTDIPAFYSEWFMNRVREGRCLVTNPVNPTRISEVSLRPADVDVIVFWTRNARPMLDHLGELDAHGYKYYFQYTLMANPRCLDPHVPPVRSAVRTMRDLAARIGPERVTWRYDPVVISNMTPPAHHERAFERIAAELEGVTERCVISIVDIYRKVSRRLAAIPGLVTDPSDPSDQTDQTDLHLLSTLARIARKHGMTIVSCAEKIDLAACGIQPGKCVDDDLVRRVFGIEVTRRKDPAQREACRCVVSRDIGAYDTCPYGCAYCYATTDPQRAIDNHRRHDSEALSLTPAAEDR